MARRAGYQARGPDTPKAPKPRDSNYMMIKDLLNGSNRQSGIWPVKTQAENAVGQLALWDSRGIEAVNY